MAKRIQHYPLPFDMSVFFVALSIICGIDRPGKAMGLLWLAFCYHKKTGKKWLGIEDWAEIFPFGMPTDEEWETWWDSQKESQVNKVDHPKYWTLNR